MFHETAVSRRILKIANSIISFIVILSLCAGGIFAAYALWDNHRVYSAAEDVQADMLKLKGVSFEELMAINKDVCAWVTLDHTNIDCPVLQGKTNLTYINTDVYGEFALAGSIFLDSRNNRDFTDTYSLLYGHHMANGSMFGDLDLYKEKAFFDKNKTGMLRVPDGAYKLEIIACIVAKSSDSYIYEPQQWRAENIGRLLSYTEQKAMYTHKDVLEELRSKKNPKILSLTTCSSEFTDARTIVLAEMKPYKQHIESGGKTK